MRCVKVSMGAAVRIGLERVVDADVAASLRMPRQWIAEVVVVQTGVVIRHREIRGAAVTNIGHRRIQQRAFGQAVLRSGRKHRGMARWIMSRVSCTGPDIDVIHGTVKR